MNRLVNPQAHPLFYQAIMALENGNLIGAESLLQQFIRAQPKNSAALHLMGVVCGLAKRHAEAIQYFRKAVKLTPNDSELHYNLAKALSDSQHDREALQHHQTATRLAPDNVNAWVNYGKCLDHLGKSNEALTCYEKAISIQPSFIQPWFNKGKTLSELGQYQEALAAYTQAYQINPQENFLLGILLHHKMLICEWTGLDELYSNIHAGLIAGNKVAEPFGLMAFTESEHDLQLCAEIFAADFYPAQTIIAENIKKEPKSKIRIGYLCGEFREQATSILMTGLYENHNPEQFEIIAFDNGVADSSEIRARLEKAFDQLIDIRTLPDLEAAQLIKQMEIDILVNLNGYFGKGRQGIFAYKPSPIQVNFLGFPGTLGARYIDYLIADPVVIPPSSKQFYDEKIAYLPNSYQVNDAKRVIANREFSRTELGLPASGFVYCCFNNNYKITPEIFTAWMNILRAVKGSVLWLLADNLVAKENLCNAAKTQGIDPTRLIFANRLPLAEHLARHQQADLFLDTSPCNAHTTASDALWAGLPLLTKQGTTFPGRVSASLLQAVGLPELIAENQIRYEALAIEYGNNPEKILKIKQKLLANKINLPLFNTELFTEHLEGVFYKMIERARANLSPADIETTQASP
ncbi:tetratricopeptide repeat protein [Polynucleobacter sp. IMCC 30228]|uniref:O-linked N-acetylglucosamine transferase, SPINDLY family protein n=1 Tax=Polynucleobacter sp. IMCC 30228 TaxID=2781011 RepID=UPI001F246FDC